MSPATYTEALAYDLDPDTWRRQIAPSTYLQGKMGPGPSQEMASIALEIHGEEIVRFRPGAPSLVRPFQAARYTGRPQTSARLVGQINAALPAPLVSLSLQDGRLVAATYRAERTVDLAPSLEWVDLADLAPASSRAWPPGTWR